MEQPKGKADGVDFGRFAVSSLFILGRQNPLRLALIRLIENKWFDRFVLLVILVNVAFMAAFDPLDIPEVNPISEKRQTLDTADFFFSVFFAVECVIKIVALGFVFEKRTYLRDPWNVLDFVVVLLGVIDLIPSLSISSVLVLRAFRVLRPLRAISRFDELRFLVVLLVAPRSP